MHNKDTISDFTILLGKWEGEGTAHYPTIETTDYTEEIVFILDDYKKVIHYEQKVLHKTSDERNGKLLHWETGFILNKEGVLYLINSQSNGRVEVMEGEVSTGGNELKAEFKSTHYWNDNKMRYASRVFILKDSILEYSLDMSITSNESSDNHLKCKLRRITE